MDLALQVVVYQNKIRNFIPQKQKDMKKISVFMALLVISTMGMSQLVATNIPIDQLDKKVEFKNGEYKLGKIVLNKPVEFTIEMKNIGQDSITLVNVQAGCGCTAPNFTPNEKFGPGQTSKILIRYSNNTKGPFTKFSTIYFDGGLSKQVSFSGEGIEETPAAPAATAKPAASVEKAKSTKN